MTVLPRDTHFDRLPSIRYRRPLSVTADDFPHFVDSWIRRHQVVKGQLIFVMNPADVAPPSDLPENQAERVHVGPLERVEVVHVYRLFKNLKAESETGIAEEPPSWPRAVYPKYQVFSMFIFSKILCLFYFFFFNYKTFHDVILLSFFFSSF